MDQALRMLEVPDIELDQLPSVQGTVIGECGHEPVARPMFAMNCSHRRAS
jgi:hypothetical protein